LYYKKLLKGTAGGGTLAAWLISGSLIVEKEGGYGK
jgi:hypothetical protein